jgi:endosialidase-like protein
MALTRYPRLALLLTLTLALSVAAFAAPVGNPRSGVSQMDWQVSISGYDRIQLTVLTPDGEAITREFKAGETPSFKLQDSGFASGSYRYELRVIPVIPASVAQRLQSARGTDDPAVIKRIMTEAGLSAEPLVQSGSFSVVGGTLVSPDAREAGSGTRKMTTDARPTTPVTNDNVIPDDLIVQGSACVGLDCVNNESFGFDTIRLKENNTRIKFDDTSVGAFPANDWQLTANDSASGAASKFSIEDITGSKVPFTVTAGASTNSIFVDSTGRVGFRTSTPVLDLHVNTSNTPAIRLEQNNSGGFTAQTWDVAGNEANFFVRDVTGGSRLPFRIRPGAPTSSIDISADGDVGVGTASPAERFHVFATADLNIFNLVENTSTGTSAAGVFSARSDTARWDVKAHSSTRTISRFGVTLGGWAELTGVTGNGLIVGTNGSMPVILGTNNVDRLHLDTDGDVGINCNNPTSDLVIASGSGCANPASNINAGSTQFTVTSSRTYKEHLEPVSVPDVLDKIAKVDVYQYDFINGPTNRLGLMAEDFHQIFGRGSDKLLDGGEVQMALWLAVKELTARNKELTDRLSQLESQVKSAQP